jgi:hypothetical protein
MVGLGNADNTSDVNKPVSTATQNSLNLKANAANPVLTGPASFNGSVGAAGQVLVSAGAGLPAAWANPGAGNGVNSNVQAALDLKADKANPTFTGSMSLQGSTGVAGQVVTRQPDGNVAWADASGGSGVTSFRGPLYPSRTGAVVLQQEDFLGLFGDRTLTNFNIGSSYNGAGVTSFGVGALDYNSASHNTAFGASAIERATTGTKNSAFGFEAARGESSSTHSDNNAFGYCSLRVISSGYNNCAFGNNALGSLTSGYFNSAFGDSALLQCTGLNNTAVGKDALLNLTTFNGCAGLGHNSQVTASNQIQLGASGTTTFVFGTVQNRSDLRDKADVRPTVLGLNFINRLRPVDYKWDMREDYRPPMPASFSEPEPDEDATPTAKAVYAAALEKHKRDMTAWTLACKHANLVRDGSKKRNRYHHGLIAQDVASVIAQTGVDFGGLQNHALSGGEDVLSVGYDELIAPLIKAVQELSQQVSAQAVEIALLKARNGTT